MGDGTEWDDAVRLSRPQASWLHKAIVVAMGRDRMNADDDQHYELWKLRAWLGGAAHLNIDELVSFTVEIQ